MLRSSPLDFFGPICAIATLFNDFSRPWFVAGGWAIDLFLGAVTRRHEDVDIAISREDQGLLHAYFTGWEFDKATKQHGVLLGWTPWPERYRLEMPDFLIRARHAGEDQARFEVFLTDTFGGLWRFGRDPVITRTVEEFGACSTIEGIPFIAPEILLLQKARYHRPQDEHDFRLTIPRLDSSQRVWLRDTLQKYRPADPWIAELDT